MPDELAQPEEEKPTVINDGSQILGISLRGWIAIIIVSVICYMAIASIPVTEPLYTLATVVVSFYFGHQMGQQSNKRTL